MYYKNCFNLYKDLILGDARIPNNLKHKIQALKDTDQINGETSELKKLLETLPVELKQEYDQKWKIVEKHIDNAMGIN